MGRSNIWKNNSWDFFFQNWWKHQSTESRILCNLIRVNKKKSTPRYIIMKLQKTRNKENLFKAAGEGSLQKHNAYLPDLFLKTNRSQKTVEWYFQWVKHKNKTNKNCHPRFLYHVKISFTNEDEIKNIFQQAKWN